MGTRRNHGIAASARCRRSPGKDHSFCRHTVVPLRPRLAAPPLQPSRLGHHAGNVDYPFGLPVLRRPRTSRHRKRTSFARPTRSGFRVCADLAVPRSWSCRGVLLSASSADTPRISDTIKGRWDRSRVTSLWPRSCARAVSANVAYRRGAGRIAFPSPRRWLCCRDCFSHWLFSRHAVVTHAQSRDRRRGTCCGRSTSECRRAGAALWVVAGAPQLGDRTRQDSWAG
jgi:hypothetical protein